MNNNKMEKVAGKHDKLAEKINKIYENNDNQRQGLNVVLNVAQFQKVLSGLHYCDSGVTPCFQPTFHRYRNGVPHVFNLPQWGPQVPQWGTPGTSLGFPKYPNGVPHVFNLPI